MDFSHFRVKDPKVKDHQTAEISVPGLSELNRVRQTLISNLNEFIYNDEQF